MMVGAKGVQGSPPETLEQGRGTRRFKTRKEHRWSASVGKERPAPVLFLALLSCLFLLLWGVVLPLAGCGGKEETTTQEGVVEEKSRETEERAEEESHAGEEKVEEEEETEELPGSGGATQFELEDQSIGSGVIMADIQLTDIYWQDHGDFSRIVFEFRGDDGEEPAGVPKVTTYYGGVPGSEEYWNIYVHLNDIILEEMRVSAFMTEGVPMDLGDPVVRTMEMVPTADTESVAFLVKCAYSPAHPGVSSRPHRLRYQTHPMRIMVDILKY